MKDSVRRVYFFSALSLYVIAAVCLFEMVKIAGSHNFDNNIPIDEKVYFILFMFSFIVAIIYMTVGLSPEVVTDGKQEAGN